jgi:HSP20 family protein
MANADVKKNQSEETGVAKQSGNELANSGNWDPFAWWRTTSNDPFSVMRHFREEMDRALGRAFGDDVGGNGGVWTPAIEVTEQNGNLKVHAELPGLKPEDVKLEVTDVSLVIEGERMFEHEVKDKGGVYRSERRYGRFYRQIPLPEGVNVDQAKAQFKNGVLEVTLPMPERKSNRRQIPIGSGTAAEQKK